MWQQKRQQQQKLLMIIIWMGVLLFPVGALQRKTLTTYRMG